MHEKAVLRDLLRKVDEVARANGSSRLTRVRLWVGALSHFSESSLRDHWNDAVPGTVAEGAKLELEVSDDRTDPRAQGVVLVSVDADPTEKSR
ncbi:MAG: hydrogenase maturation nickel metallochaperone HypA [Thermoplasmata archaeon]|jgi:hydrogenase nickel incorporation protein HypA/HybF